MGEYSDREWYIKGVKTLTSQYGDVPPPWVMYPTTHPYSICWRMGGGETHIMILWEWLAQQNWQEQERIAYLKKYMPPPRWLQWAADFLWGLKPWETEEQFDYSSYFKKLETLGFEGVSSFEEDFNNEKWD